MKENKLKQVILNDDEYYYSLLRKNVKEIRKSKGLTQQDLADLTYLSREYICDIENEKRNKHPSLSVIGRLADALEVEIGLLFRK
ncbi:MAG: helix-turn-helix transcriptional regulator [Bacilli bacterium]|nr:helix-turn-helix transcriptional regulator [Bacilli bacterium]